MASIKFISNSKEKIQDVIYQIFRWAYEVDIAVAYLKSGGYKHVRDLLIGKEARILVGLDFWLTDIEPLEDILKNGFSCKIYKTPLTEEEKSYHPKIYIAKRNEEVKAIIGSSNLTIGGLYSNVESNILVSGSRSENGIKELLEFFEEKWTSSLSKELDHNLISNYQESKKAYEKERRKLNEKVSSFYVDRIEKISNMGDSAIVCLTRQHDLNDIYDRLIGVPIRAKKIALNHIKKGTRIFIYYIGEGISKVVEALDAPYIDYEVINEWKDGLPETYPVRIKTKLLFKSKKSIKFKRLEEMGICRVDTGKKIVGYHLQNSVVPISNNDGDAIEKELL